MSTVVAQSPLALAFMARQDSLVDSKAALASQQLQHRESSCDSLCSNTQRYLHNPGLRIAGVYLISTYTGGGNRERQHLQWQHRRKRDLNLGLGSHRDSTLVDSGQPGTEPLTAPLRSHGAFLAARRHILYHDIQQNW